MKWHHLFGLGLTDFFTHTNYRVELEKDLSLKQQFLDVVIIEQGEGEPVEEFPDGLENLAAHNLLTYKSLRQPLDGWALDELVGHYVNYRKQISPSPDNLLPVDEFGLFAVSTREPKKLAQEASFDLIKEGVYETLWGTRKIRIIVLSQLPRTSRNAIWLLYSGVSKLVNFGADHYHWRQEDHSTVVNRLYEYYNLEGSKMPYTWDDYFREHKHDVFEKLRTEREIWGVPVEEILQKIFQTVPTEDRLKGLSQKEILKSMSIEEIEAYLKEYRKHQKKARLAPQSARPK